MLVKLGHAALDLGRNDDAEAHLEEALADSRRADDVRTQSLATLQLAELAWWRGDSARCWGLTLQSIASLEQETPGRELASAYVNAARFAVIGDRSKEGLEWSEKALSVAARVGAQTQSVAALTARGGARCDLGDLGGMDDLRSAVREGRKLGIGDDTGWAYNWLAECSWLIEGGERGKKTYEEAIEFADRRGFVSTAMINQADFLRVLFDLGDWDQVHGLTGELLNWSEACDDAQVEANALLGRAQVLLWRGHYGEAGGLQGLLLELARRIEDLQVLVPALAVSALIEQSRGNTRDAVNLIEQLDQATRDHAPFRARHLPTVVRVLIWAGELAKAEDFVKDMDVAALRDRNCLLTGRALVAEARADHHQAIELYDDAAQRWADFGFALEHGQALLGAARSMLVVGRSGDVLPRLNQAREIFTKLEARPLLAEIGAQLQRATALTS